MRIIAGRFRRRTLETNPGLTTRPITDRVKEALFARIETDLPGTCVADIFAGTGTLGLESLSRGASRITFIEKDRRAVELLRTNVRKLDVKEETLVWPADVRRCSFRPQRAASFFPFDLIFFDPPYRFVPQIVPGSPLYGSLERLATSRVSSPDARMIFRAPEHAKFDLPPEWQPEWGITRSGMTILYFVKAHTTAGEPGKDDSLRNDVVDGGDRK